MSTLMLHSGAEEVTRQELRNVFTPEATATWNPVAHAEVVETVLRQSDQMGLVLSGEKYGLTSEGKKLFGLLSFESPDLPDYTRCLGINNSHDKTLSLGLACGASVLVCDNLMLCGSLVARRKHTSGLSLYDHIAGIMEHLLESFLRLDNRIIEMRNTPYGWQMAKTDLVDLACQGVINSSSIVPIIDEFINPRHEEFTQPTEWNYYNAITEITKSYPQQRALEMHRGLANHFNIK